jgi:hypothetical protein
MGQGLEGTEKPVVDAGGRESVKKFHQEGRVFRLDWTDENFKTSRGHFLGLIMFRIWADD